MEIANILTCRRPHFLLATLRTLAAADVSGVRYRICIDYNFHEEIPQVVKWFASKVGEDRVESVYRPPHHDQGPARNNLWSIRESLDYNPDLIYVFDDDCLVSVDYFTFHRSVHELTDRMFAVTPFGMTKYADPPAEHLDLAYMIPNSMTLGISMRPDNARRLVETFPDDYLDDRHGFMNTHFPGSGEYVGIDGALKQLQLRENHSYVFPEVPRLYHIGFIGTPCWERDCQGRHDTDGLSRWHRHGQDVRGDLEYRADQVMRMTAQELRMRAPGWEDFCAYDVSVPLGPIRRIIENPEQYVVSHY